MKPSANAPSRPAGRYHGHKWLLAPWILEHIPARHDLYCEPFGGLAAVLLRKERSPIEVYNDLDGDLVNYFRILREDPDRLVRAIALTPFAKTEWELGYEPTPDPVERARRFYIRAYMSIAGPTAQWNTGWRRQKKFSRGNDGRKMMTPAAMTFAKTDHLYDVANRLRGVTIECDAALAIIERYDHSEAVFYCDPPYVHETRGRWSGQAYNHEMSDGDHRKMAAVLHHARGMVILSGYDSALYQELFSDWRRIDRQARVNGPGHAIESLWLNPAVCERLAEEEARHEHERQETARVMRQPLTAVYDDRDYSDLFKEQR